MVRRSQNFWLVAFFLAKYSESNDKNESIPPGELNVGNWKEAYSLFFSSVGDGRTYEAFENSLKNARDSFDSHLITSGRTGWQTKNGNAAQLPKIAYQILKEFGNLERHLLFEKIVKITDRLNSFSIVESKKIGKNPNWAREELILALDLYFTLDQGQMHKGNPKVVALSDFLKKLKIHTEIGDPEKFRNPSGISRRLGNFKTMDDNYKGEGLTNSGHLAKIVWDEFHLKRDELSKQANSIYKSYSVLEKEEKLLEINFEISSDKLFNFNYHKNLEKNPLTLKLKKKSEYLLHDKLECSVCKFQPVKFYGELGYNVIEIHYINKINIDAKPIDLADFILICPNCHKILDQNYPVIDFNDLQIIINS